MAVELMEKPKKNAVKHYLVTLDERNGEYEYKHVLRLKLPARKKPEVALRNISKDWYDATRQEADGGYYFNCGEVHVSVGLIKEISELAFNELDGIVTHL